MSRFAQITFDCYDTLVDWETGIGNAFVAAAGAEGVALEPSRGPARPDHAFRTLAGLADALT